MPRTEDEDSGDAFQQSGTELLMPKFSFMPLHRMYSYPSGGMFLALFSY